ncbi:DUF2145 domain-containing protein [Maricaulis sp.]|uniref:DUF2145 domain-containing protein n=1 Tax=Maricaulis sp. TaxID=1486257 RepID=UPI002620C74C|nr:DUF2145 domain-containing protein [Maricaulis sp.]
MRTASLAALALFALCAEDAQAGSEARPVSHFPIELSADFAKQIERNLAASGTRIAMVFRTGRAREDLPDGIRYTHGAFWIYSEVAGENGEMLRGYSVHNLYHGEDNRQQSYLAQDWPLNFTQGDVVGEVGIIIPSPEMQRRLLMLFVRGDIRALHQPAYSLIANPLDERFQNCNELMLDMVAAAAWETTDRDVLKTNLAAWFEPARVQTSLLERMFGPSVDDRIRLDDHDGPIRTATFASMGDFMTRFNLASDVYELKADFLDASES